jgi:hypothetical protein
LKKEDIKIIEGRMHFSESVNLPEGSVSTVTEGKKEKKSSSEVDDLSAVEIEVEAIHAGRTKNNTIYQASKLRGDATLRSGIHSWTTPYNKPFLTHHNQRDGEPVGRVTSASFSNTTNASREGIIITAEIVDKDAMQKVLDGRYKTVSIGGETDSSTCSICGQDIIKDGFCGHWPGDTYDGEKCAFIIGNVWFHELSFVNVPADEDAMVTSINPIKKSGSTTESFDYGIYDKVRAFKEKGLSEQEIAEQWDELTKDQKEEVKKFSDLEKLSDAHEVLHYLFSHKEYNWSEELIQEWHQIVVQLLTDDYEYDHKILDNLDK